MAVKSFLGADLIDEWRPRAIACRWGDTAGDDAGNNADAGAYSYSDGGYSGGFDSADAWSSYDSGGSFDSGGGSGSDFSSAFDSGGGGVAFGDAGVGSGGFGTGDFGGAFDGGGYFGGSDSNFTGDFGGGGGWGDVGFADYGGGGFSDYGGGGWDSGFPGVSYADAPFSGGWGGYDGGFNAGDFGGPSFGISGPGDVFGGLYGGLYGGPGETLSGMDIAGDFGPNAANMGNSLGGVTGGMPGNVNPNTPYDAGNQGLNSNPLTDPLIGAATMGPAGLIAGIPASILGGTAITGGIVGTMFGDRGGPMQTPTTAQTLPDVQIVADRPDIANPLAQPQQSNFGPAQTAQVQSQFGPEVSQAPNNATIAQAAPSPGIMQQAPPNMQEVQGAPPQTAPPNMQAANPFAAPSPSMALPSIEASKVGELVGTPGQAGRAAQSLLDMTPEQMNASLREAAQPGSVQPLTTWDRIADFFTPGQARATDDPTKAIADALKFQQVGPFVQTAPPGTPSVSPSAGGASFPGTISSHVPVKGSRPIEPSAIVVHYSGGPSGETLGSLLDRLQSRGIGYNFYVDSDGKIFEAVPPNMKSGHVGPGKGNKFDVANKNSIGIAAIAPDEKSITPQQRDAMRDLAQRLGATFNIPSSRVFGHGEVSPGRREADEGKSTVNWARAQPNWPGGTAQAFMPMAPAPAQPGKSAFGPFTAYAPGTGGDMEGGVNAAKKGADGTYRAHTAEDVRAARARGEDDYVTLAKHDRSPYKYGQEINIPTLTYQDRDGKWQTLNNVRGVVHDRGVAKALRYGALDVATFSGKGLTDKQAKPLLAGGIKTDGPQIAFAPSPAVPLPNARPMQPAAPVPNIPGVTLPAFQPTAPAVPSQPAGGQLAPLAPPAREAPQAQSNARFVPQAPPGRELQQDQPRSVAFLPPEGQIPQAPSGAQSVPQAPTRATERSPALAYELLPNLDPGGLHGATPGTSPLASGWLASQQSRGPAFPGWAGVGNPLSGGEFGGLPAEYGENYGIAGPPTAPSRGVMGSPPGLPGTLPDPTATGSPPGLPGQLPVQQVFNPNEGATGSPPGLPGEYGDEVTGSPPGLPGSDYQGYGQEGVPVAVAPTAPAVPDTMLAPRSPDSAAPLAFKSEPMLSPEKQFDVNSKTISSKFNLTAEQKQSGKDFFSGLTAKERAAIVEGKTNIMDLIARKAVEQHPYAARIVDVPAKAREFVEQNYPGGIQGLQRDATHRDMTQPTPSGILSELARPGGAAVYDNEPSVAAMPTSPAMPSWMAPSANTTQPASLMDFVGPVQASSKGDLPPTPFDARFGDWGTPTAFMPEAPSPPAVQEAEQAARSDPQTAQQIAQANPQAVQQIAQQLGVDILTAAMVLSMEEGPRRYIPPGDNGSGFGRWPQLPTPDHPGQFAGLGREIVRQNYEAQNPLNSLSAMMESGGMQFNPASWDAVLAHAPYSENIEDRRNQMMIGMR